MEHTKETQIHVEADLHCAAFVLARGFPLLGLQRSGKRYLFEFASGAVEAAQEYAENAPIPARDYADAISRLKNSLYSEKFKEDRNENGNRIVCRNYRR
jgi:hypothetical protein